MKLSKEKYRESLLKNDRKSFEEYLKENSSFGESRYSDALTEAATKLHLGSSDHGATASDLADRGLSSSGYADYLSGKAIRDYENAALSAKRRLEADRGEELSGYEKYISDYDSMQKKISKSVIESIKNSSEFDLEKAYETAVRAGLAEPLAFESAAAGVAGAKEKAYQDALLFVKLNAFTPKRAEEYAKSIGLDDRTAKRLYDELAQFKHIDSLFLDGMSSEAYYYYVMSQAQAKSKAK